MSKPEDSLKPTGIPTHVLYMNSLNTFSDNIIQIIPAVEQASESVVNGVMNIIEDSAMIANTVTRNGLSDLLKSSFSEMLNQHGVLELIRNIPESRSSLTKAITTTQLYQWSDGLSHRVQMISIS